MTPIERAARALKPFAEIQEWAVRNGRSIPDIDFLIREDGRVLGSGMISMEDIAEAHAALVEIAPEILAEEG